MVGISVSCSRAYRCEAVCDRQQRVSPRVYREGYYSARCCGRVGRLATHKRVIGRIMTGEAAKFVASLPEMGTLQCRVVAVDRVNLAALDERAIASPYGGPVPAQLQSGTQQLLPLEATYQVRLGGCMGSATLTRQITGTAMIGAARESFASRGLRALLAIVSREAGL